MKRLSILAVAIPASLMFSLTHATSPVDTKVELKDVQPVQRFEQVISGHLADLNGNFASQKSLINQVDT